MTSPIPSFTDEQSLIAATEELGQQALRQGSIHSFIVRHFADSSQFYIPDEQQEPLTPEQAYMRFKAMVRNV